MLSHRPDLPRPAHAATPRSPPAAPARSPAGARAYGEGETDPVKAEQLLAYELAPGREEEYDALVAAAASYPHDPAQPVPYDVAPTEPSAAHR